jgi:hypothetical protein
MIRFGEANRIVKKPWSFRHYKDDKIFRRSPWPETHPFPSPIIISRVLSSASLIWFRVTFNCSLVAVHCTQTSALAAFPFFLLPPTHIFPPSASLHNEAGVHYTSDLSSSIYLAVRTCLIITTKCGFGLKGNLQQTVVHACPLYYK